MLNESLKTARTRFGQKISYEVFEKLVKMDKSKTYKYVEKICELYLKGFSLETIENVISDYDKYCRWMDNKDITNKTYTEISSDIEIAKIDSTKSKTFSRKAEDVRNLLAEIDGVRFYKIDDFYDSYKKGKGSHWCTSLSKVHFDSHIQSGEHFLILNNTNLTFDSPFKLRERYTC